MAVENIKTAAITNMNATPPVRTTDYGATAERAFASVAVADAKTTPSTYQLFRLPSHAKLQSLKVWLDAANTTFAGDITLYYSETAFDGTNANSGVGQVAAAVYATAKDLHAQVTPLEVYQGGNITGANLGKALWQDAGLSSDPGGFFDIVVKTTSTNSGAAVLNAVCEFVRR